MANALAAVNPFLATAAAGAYGVSPVSGVTGRNAVSGATGSFTSAGDNAATSSGNSENTFATPIKQEFFGKVGMAYGMSVAGLNRLAAADTVAQVLGGGDSGDIAAADAGDTDAGEVAADSQTASGQTGSAEDGDQAGDVGTSRGADGEELTDDEQRYVRELKTIDGEVRAHEQAHMAAGGSLVRGGASFEYETGPDGKRYAVAGEVQIDASSESTPEKTAQKMRTVRRAALAPAEPSAQDRKVAAEASARENQALMEVLQEKSAAMKASSAASSGASSETSTSSGAISDTGTAAASQTASSSAAQSAMSLARAFYSRKAYAGNTEQKQAA